MIILHEKYIEKIKENENIKQIYQKLNSLKDFENFENISYTKNIKIDKSLNTEIKNIN